MWANGFLISLSCCGPCCVRVYAITQKSLEILYIFIDYRSSQSRNIVGFFFFYRINVFPSQITCQTLYTFSVGVRKPYVILFVYCIRRFQALKMARWLLWIGYLVASSHGLSLRHARHQSAGTPTAEEILDPQIVIEDADHVFRQRASDMFSQEPEHVEKLNLKSNHRRR